MTIPAHDRHVPNWYELLQLTPEAPEQTVRAATEQLSRRASALANTAPERAQQLRDQVRAIRRDLLSGDEARADYDRALANAAPVSVPSSVSAHSGAVRAGVAPSGPARPATPVELGVGGRIMQFLRSAWTCPSCGASGMPTDVSCGACGAPMRRLDDAGPPEAEQGALTCGSCRSRLEPNDRFCSSCGTPAR